MFSTYIKKSEDFKTKEHLFRRQVYKIDKKKKTKFVR